MQILVQYLAFRSNFVFEFTARPAGKDIREMELGDVLEFVFRQCNHVDGEEWISKDPYASTLRLRSMCVDDEILIVDAAKISRFRVAGVGFQPVEQVR